MTRRSKRPGPTIEECIEKYLTSQRARTWPQDVQPVQTADFRNTANSHNIYLMRELNVDFVETFKVEGLPDLAYLANEVYERMKTLGPGVAFLTAGRIGSETPLPFVSCWPDFNLRMFRGFVATPASRLRRCSGRRSLTPSFTLWLRFRNQLSSPSNGHLKRIFSSGEMHVGRVIST